MTRFSALLLLLFAFSLSVTAQRSVVGSGKLIKQERSLDDFSGLDISGAVQATITYGSAYRVEITADDNLVDHVETEVRGERLVIKMKSRYSYNNATVRATVVMPYLKEVRGSGASRLVIEGFQQAGKSIELDVSGATNVSFKDSRAGMVDLNASGAASIDLTGIPVEQAKIEVAGASSVKLNASDHVRGNASGASSVRVSGGASIDVESSGASRVR
ncbi:GIN domain-containing protein [Lewinella sp. 4G2]|uniref:GIN domain-containing protein n=1 Tax=Lewinella sp. 4G2 TaxID=1803372 RepID=UPI0007B4C122|nr:DUF2807 domain-containing protein [Lewinella sp. 4G2]OAV43242.1 hypothetical protein A3850_001455 [Lewinella sp. 4G2]